MNPNKSIWSGLGALAVLLAGCGLGELKPLPPQGDGDETSVADVAGGPDGGPTEPGPSTGGTSAQALFEANVYPALQASCSPGGACHSATDPAFVLASASGSYAAIKNFRDRLFPGYDPAAARLIENGAGGHQGANFQPSDIDAIEAWLSAEKIENSGSDEVSPLAAWSGCMTLADWDAQGVAEAWANKNAQGQGRCEACHNLGADGFMASDQSKRVFDTITTNPALMPSYFTLDAQTQSVIINRARLQNVGTRQAPHQEHGAFDVDGDAMQQLQQFYDLTLARQAAGQCGPPRFPQ